MKLSAFFIFFMTIQVLATDSYSQAKLLSVDITNSTVDEVLKTLEQESEFYFVYSPRMIDVDRRVSIHAENQNINGILDQLFKGTDVRYVVKDRQIVLSTEERLSLLESQQPRKIAGKVVDQNGAPLTGVTVSIKNTTTGTITDIDGEFELAVQSGADVLIFSFVGLKTQEVEIGNQTFIDVLMEEDRYGMDEVIVIGYGSVKKSDLTGSVSTIKTDQIESIPANKVGELLQGRSTGLQIVVNSDDPEAGISARIRGASSLKGSREPLVVVDGIPYGTLNDLNQLNSGDIASIEILKDASAAAIFGSQGANGVILVTTKLGEVGKQEVFVESSYSIAQYTKEFERYTDLVQAAELRNLSLTNDGSEPLFTGQTWNGYYFPSVEEFENGTYKFYDWLPLTLNENPVTWNVRAGIRGGTAKNRYLVSLNYFNQEGQVKGDVYDKVGILVNDDIQINDKLHFRFSANMSDIDRVYGTGGDYTNGGRPWYPAFNEDGSYYIPFDNYYHQLQAKDDYFNKKKGFDLRTNGEFSWKIFPWLTFSSKISYNTLRNRNDYYQKAKYTLQYYSYAGYGSITESSNNQTYFTNTLNFNKNFDGIHDISLMLGRDDQVQVNRSIGIIGKDFVTDALFNENLPLASIENQEITQSYSRQDLQSYFGRANYSLLNKYLFTFTFRADGSSKFGENNKWGYFPAGAVAWKLHNEDFLNGLSYLDVLKLRVSAGKTGNQGIPPYGTFERYGDVEVYDWQNTQNRIAAGPGYVEGGYYGDMVGLGNPNLKWESTSQIAAAIETGFLKNRLRFSIETYFKHTTDLLRDKFLPSSSGFTRILVNSGVVDNWGVEFQLGGDVIETADFSFDADLLFSLNRNTVIDIGSVEDAGLIKDDHGNEYVYADPSGEVIYAIDQPLNSYYGYICEGPIQASEEMPFAFGSYNHYGDFHYKDLNDNGVNDEGDRTIIGDPTPDFIASLNLSFRYKKFDFYMLLNAVYGNEVLDRARDNRPYGWTKGWTLENQRTEFRQVRNAYNQPNSTFYVVDGSFLRLQTLNAGYNISIPNQKIFKQGRIFCNISNLFVIDHGFEGYDPEVGINGVYNGGSPRQRRFTFGLNLTF